MPNPPPEEGWALPPGWTAPNYSKGFYVLGLDLGTRAGWSVLTHEGALLDWGAWDMAPDKWALPSFRFVKYGGLLKHKIEQFQRRRPLLVGFELVPTLHVFNGTHAAAIHLGQRAKMVEVCDTLGVPYEGQHLGKVKKMATGSGNAGKLEMVDAANTRWPTLNLGAGNADEADSLWVAEHLLVVNHFKPAWREWPDKTTTTTKRRARKTKGRA